MIKKCSEADRERVLQFANRYPCENLFIIGDIETFGIDNEKVQVWVEEFDGELEGIYLKYYNNMVIFSEHQKFDPNELVCLINEQGIKNINGLKQTITPLLPYLNDFDTQNCYYCTLTEGNHLETDIEGCITPTIEDAPELYEELKKIEEFHFDEENMEENVRNYFLEPQRINVMYKKDGKLAGFASTAVQSSTSVMIVSVFTVKEFRNQGIASKVVSALCHKALELNKGCVLFYDNPKAGSIYHRLGFKTVDEWCLLHRVDH